MSTEFQEGKSCGCFPLRKHLICSTLTWAILLTLGLFHFAPVHGIAYFPDTFTKRGTDVTIPFCAGELSVPACNHLCMCPGEVKPPWSHP